jgi:hypothetical protein
VFFLTRTNPLFGNIISEQGIVVDPEKIEAIKGWPTPNNVS